MPVRPLCERVMETGGSTVLVNRHNMARRIEGSPTDEIRGTIDANRWSIACFGQVARTAIISNEEVEVFQKNSQSP